MNEDEDLTDLLIEEQFLKDSHDPFNNFHLKTSLKEEEDFIILNEDVHLYLHKIYGGNVIPRYSIEVEQDEDFNG